MIEKIPILTFHSIDLSGSIISITPSRFSKLLRILKQKAYQTITFYDLIKWLTGEMVFDSPRFIITFDDGFENIYNQAFPILETLGFNATVFLTTKYCGKTNDWLFQNSPIPQMSMLKWEQVNEMSKYAFDIQAHTRSHPFLFKLPPEEVKEELLGSKIDIENRLGKKVDFFAYPNGFFNRGEDIMVRQIFKAACSTQFNFTTPKCDRHLLPRIDMYYFSQAITSNLFLSSCFSAYFYLRKLIRLIGQTIKN